MRRIPLLIALFIGSGSNMDACGAVIGPLPYGGVEDSPFPEFGIAGSFVLEDFEDGQLNVPGVILADRNSVFAGETSITTRVAAYSANSIEGFDDEGRFLLTTPTVCALSYPPQCPTNIRLQFNAEAFGSLPTYVALAWTDAVRLDPQRFHPLAKISVSDSQGQVIDNLELQPLPARNELGDVTSDDILLGFVAHQGISQLDFSVTTDQEGGVLSVDHLQFGLAALPGDSDRDGDVDFDDFSVLASHFQSDTSNWGRGDFDFDGVTSFSDFVLLASNFNRQLDAIQSPVPEPSNGLLLVLGVIWLADKLRAAQRARKPCRH